MQQGTVGQPKAALQVKCGSCSQVINGKISAKPTMNFSVHDCPHLVLACLQDSPAVANASCLSLYALLSESMQD